MAVSLNDQTFTTYEQQLACALILYMQASDNTIGSIIAFLRHGRPGAEITPCHGLLQELQHSQPGMFTTVANNSTYWGPQARNQHHQWVEAHSHVAQR